MSSWAWPTRSEQAGKSGSPTGGIGRPIAPRSAGRVAFRTLQLPALEQQQGGSRSMNTHLLLHCCIRHVLGIVRQAPGQEKAGEGCVGKRNHEGLSCKR